MAMTQLNASIRKILFSAFSARRQIEAKKKKTSATDRLYISAWMKRGEKKKQNEKIVTFVPRWLLSS